MIRQDKPNGFKTRALRFLRALSLFSLILVSHLANASSEVLSGVQLSSCNQIFCTKLSIPKAERSILDSIYVFGSAKMRVFDRKEIKKTKLDKSKAEFTGTDGYYDPDAGRIILRGIEGQKFSELVFDLNTGNTTYF